MQPIIRRTITITLTETWTITWPDGRETTWPETHEMVWPAVDGPDELLPPITNDEERDDDTLDPDAAATTAEDEPGLITPFAPGQANPATEQAQDQSGSNPKE